MKKNIRFEDSLKRLEEIVETLETGVEDLDRIVNLFEEGSGLVQSCNEKLTQIENKIEVLSKKLQKSHSAERGENEYQ
ncbi:MAG: exodeoxyribonuclease VII small subunit [Armatimonadetes bacterium]|nr:exodeoxyribonuclease VII small subunit [Armatimonadota bacterium]